MSAIHAREGFTFERLTDASVRIRLTRPVVPTATNAPPLDPPSHAVLAEAVIPANEWASVVAFVTAAGDNSSTFEQALAFHGAA